MGLNEASQAEDLLVAGGKPLNPMTPQEEVMRRRKRTWKGFYGSVHDIVSLHHFLAEINLLMLWSSCWDVSSGVIRARSVWPAQHTGLSNSKAEFCAL